MVCEDYQPDWVVTGDCRRCGHTALAHLPEPQTRSAMPCRSQPELFDLGEGWLGEFRLEALSA